MAALKYVIERRVLEQLLGEMQESGVYQRLIAQRIDAYFAQRWVPNCRLPKATVESMQLLKKQDRVAFEMIVRVLFDGWWDVFRGSASLYFDWKSYQTEEELLPKVRAILPKLVGNAAKAVESSLPTDVEKYLSGNALFSRDRAMKTAAAVASHPGLKAVIAERTPSIQTAYDAQLAQRECPDGFQPDHITSLELRCEVFYDTWENILRIRMDNGIFWEKKIRFDPSYYPLYQDPAKRLEALYPRALNSVEALLRQAADVPLLYSAASPRDLPGMTDSLDTLLRQGSVSLGCVTVQWDGPQLRDGQLLYQPEEDEGKVRFSPGEGMMPHCPVVPLYPALLRRPPDASHGKTELPRDLAGICALGEALQKALEEAFQGTDLPLPEVKLQANQNFHLVVLWGIRKVVLAVSEKDVETVLKELAVQIYQDERFRPPERKAQLRVLNTLDPTELAILRYVMENGKTSCGDLMHAMGDRIPTSKHYTMESLLHLTEVEVPVDGKAVPLLRVPYLGPYGYDVYTDFQKAAQIEPAVLQAAVGRPYYPAEVMKMRAPERGQWFTSYLLEADEEQCAARFNEALIFTNRSFLTKFVRSQEGQAFLRKITGSDAMYVRQAVEELPGCKWLAAEIWPEMAEAGSEEDA